MHGPAGRIDNEEEGAVFSKVQYTYGLPRETPKIVCADDRVRVEWMHQEVHMGKSPL